MTQKTLIFPSIESEYMTSLENEEVVELVIYPPDFEWSLLILLLRLEDWDTEIPCVGGISLENHFRANLDVFFFFQMKLQVFPHFSKVHITLLQFCKTQVSTCVYNLKEIWRLGKRT